MKLPETEDALDIAVWHRRLVRAAVPPREVLLVQEVAKLLQQRMQTPTAGATVLCLAPTRLVLPQELRHLKRNNHVVVAGWSPMTASRWRRFGLHQASYLCGMAEQLPFAEACFDVLYSNLGVVPRRGLSACIAELRRVLKPGGSLLFSMWGSDNLAELRAAWETIDASAHVHWGPTVQELGDTLMRMGFQRTVVEVERVAVQYDNLGQLIEDLRRYTMTNLSTQRRRGCYTPRQRARLRQAFQDISTNNCVNFEILIAHARHADTTVTVPVGQIRRLL